MKNKQHVIRYAMIMLLGIAFNLGLYQIAHVFHLPFWMDSIGTAYVAIVLEPAAGLLVAFATNFYQAAIVYDSSSLMYYMVSASAAICFGILIRKHGVITWKRLGIALFSYFIVATLLSSALTLWRTHGVPDSGWERQFYTSALQQGVPIPLACLFGTAILKCNDVLLMAIVLPILCKLTPKPFKNEELHDVVSWKNPYFHKQRKEE